MADAELILSRHLVPPPIAVAKIVHNKIKGKILLAFTVQKS